MKEQKPTRVLIEAFVNAGFTAADIAVFQGWSVAKARYWLKKFDLKAAKENGSIGAKSLKLILYSLFPAYPIEEEYHIGNRLRLDFYIPSIYTAFEVDGSQHRELTPLFHSGSLYEFSDAWERDQKKEQWCKENNILLIRLPDTAVIEACKDQRKREYLIKLILDDIARVKPTGPEKKEEEKPPVSERYLAYQERMKTLSKQARQENYRKAKALKDKLKEESPGNAFKDN